MAQLACNSSFPNSTARAKPVFRTKSQSRIHNSEISWALGFFGPSFSALSNPTFANFANAFDVVVITEHGTKNDTLAAYDSCFNDNFEGIGYIRGADLYT